MERERRMEMVLQALLRDYREAKHNAEVAAQMLPVGPERMTQEMNAKRCQMVIDKIDWSLATSSIEAVANAN